MPQVSAMPKLFHIQNPYGTDSINTYLYSTTDAALQNSGVQNPLIQLNNEWDKTIAFEYRTVGSIFAEITFLKHFTFKSTFYGDINNYNSRQYVPLYNAYDPLTNMPLPSLISKSTSVTENDNTIRKFQQDEILTYLKSFGRNNVTATAGFTTYYSGYFNRGGVTTQDNSATGVPIPNNPRFWYISNGFSPNTNSFSSSNQAEYATVSELVRVLYNYDRKYFINASLRNDASSQIGINNRNQQFWAVGAAWDITKENFMKNQNIFDFIKIKGSIGLLGNQSAFNFDGSPNYYPLYPTRVTGANAIFGNNIFVAAKPSYIANPNLRWETVNAHDAGIELNAFKNRLTFVADYFNNTTNNLMTNVDRSPLGLVNELINGGSIRNWGEEFSATWNQAFSKDLNLTVSGNITFLQNKVISLALDLPGGVIDIASTNNGEAISETKPGLPIGYFKGYVVTGLYQSYADILKSPPEGSLGGSTPRPGDFKYKDVNGDHIVNSSDRTEIGNPTPKFTYGGNINLTYKGLNLSIDVGGVYGNQVYRTWGSLESPFQRVNYAAYQLGAWHGAGTSNWVPIISQGDRINFHGSTYSIEDGSYFRIRNAQLGYSIPQKAISKARFKSLRIFVNIQNAITWKNNSGYTAEFGGSATQFGYDTAGGAIPAITTFGLNATF
jgi:TonB-linked SusC/RagA family outer membrane protein